MSIPNFYQTVVDTANRYPSEFKQAHTGGPNTELFIRILAYELHKLDPRWGLNGKRGDYNVISQDAVSWFGQGVGTDPKTGKSVTVVDVIGGAGGPNPTPTWQVLNDPNKHTGVGGWIKPEPVPGYQTPVIPTPAPAPQPSIPIGPAPTPVSELEKLNHTLMLVLEQLKKNENETKRLGDILAKGFSIKAKAGWPVGEIGGEINVKS